MAPKRAVFKTWGQHLQTPPQLGWPCAKRDQYILHVSAVWLSTPRISWCCPPTLVVAWLHFGLQKELEFMPQVLDRVEVRTFHGCFPPVDAILLKEGPCSLRGMLWVIILHKTMIRQLLSNKRTRVVSRMLQKRTASMMPSKMQIFVAPCLLIPPQTWTLIGCFGFGLHFIGSSIFL